jgi:hypothetical protein
VSHQNSGPRDYVHKAVHNQLMDELRAEIAELHGIGTRRTAKFVELKRQLLDAKRNEERVVAKLHTLEAAVRAVRDGYGASGPLSKLHALVPDAPEGTTWSGAMPKDAPSEISFVLDFEKDGDS